MFRRDAPHSDDTNTNIEQTDEYKRGWAEAEARAKARAERDAGNGNLIEQAHARADEQARKDYQAGPPQCALTRANFVRADCRPPATTIEEAKRREDEDARKAYMAGPPACAFVRR